MPPTNCTNTLQSHEKMNCIVGFPALLFDDKFVIVERFVCVLGGTEYKYLNEIQKQFGSELIHILVLCVCVFVDRRVSAFSFSITNNAQQCTTMHNNAMKHLFVFVHCMCGRAYAAFQAKLILLLWVLCFVCVGFAMEKTRIQTRSNSNFTFIIFKVCVKVPNPIIFHEMLRKCRTGYCLATENTS